VRVGGHYVDPKSDNHEVVSVDTGGSLTFNVTYMFATHWGIELLAAYPAFLRRADHGRARRH
jgi:outer membrane protein W